METVNCFITEFYPRALFNDTQIDNRRTIFFMETILEEQEQEQEQQEEEGEKGAICFNI